MTHRERRSYLVYGLIRRDGKKCAYCHRPFRRKQGRGLTVDHVVPLALGGSKGKRMNLVLACAKCNTAKDNTPADEWRPFLLGVA